MDIPDGIMGGDELYAAASSSSDPQASTSMIAMDVGDDEHIVRASQEQRDDADEEPSPWAAGADAKATMDTLGVPMSATTEAIAAAAAAARKSQSILDSHDDFEMSMSEGGDTIIGQRSDRRLAEELYTETRPGAGAPSEYSEGADWPSKMATQQRLRRRSFQDSSEEEADAAESSASTRPRGIRSGLLYSSTMMLHAVPTYCDPDRRGDHPEQPDRIRVIFEKLKEQGLVRRMKRIKIREVSMAEVMLVHDKSIWDGVQRTAFFTHESLAAQTHLLERSSLYINEHSALCARLSCGGVIEMCDAVARGRVRNGFAIVRPPGHHAEPDRPMGFCLYNNVAVAACYLRERYGHLEGPKRCKRILILDWDVHHGNGTQAKFYNDPDILYMSLHRYDNGTFFPEGKAGDHDQVGEGKGEGRNVNVPWPDEGMDDGDYIAAFYRIIMPIATEFAPDLVIISAGFDAARGDPLGGCDVTPLGYAHMAYDLASLANGKLVVALEGGYNLDAIANSALAVTEVLLGGAPPALPVGLTCSTKADDTFKLVERSQAPYWNCMHKSALEPELDEDEELDSVQLPQLIALHRAQQIAKRYDLAVLPFSSSTAFEGQALCSIDLLSRPRHTLVVFVHDMGNLRAEELPSGDLNVSQELFTFVDGSSRVLDWTHQSDMSVIDICLHFQLPTVARMPLSGSTRRRNAHKMPFFDDACRWLSEVWDGYVEMALTVQRSRDRRTDVVLIGLGTACAAVMNLIEAKRPHITESIRAIVQLPGHSTIPTIPKGDHQLRKWYYSKTLAILPYNHAYYTYDTQAQAGKRLGQIYRSQERRAVQLLRTEFSRIEAFITQSIPRLARVLAAGNGTNGNSNDNGGRGGNNIISSSSSRIGPLDAVAGHPSLPLSTLPTTDDLLAGAIGTARASVPAVDRARDVDGSDAIFID